MKQLFQKRKWSELPSERSFIIDPFDPINLTPFSYDLSIGDEAFSCRTESHSSFPLGESKDDAYKMQPGETIIVRTMEYLALPPCYSATAWPRFNLVREGIFQSMVKIDPTWYGQLGIALTNLSPAEYPIWKGKEFATLILYHLTEDSDITLYSTGEFLDEAQRPIVDLSNMEPDGLQRKIADSGLQDKCTIEQDKLILTTAFSPDDFRGLMGFFDERDWKSRVERAMRMKTMFALGLPGLDLILDKDPDGERLERAAVAGGECTQQALIDAAVERGRPFDIIANIPKLVTEHVDEQVQSRLDREMGSNIMPRIIGIIISLLGFISLIVAIIALVAHYLKWEFPKEIDIHGTIVVAVIMITVALVPALVYVFSLRRIPSGIAQAKRQIEETNKKLAQELRGVDENIRDKTRRLWSEIDSIKNRLKEPEKEKGKA